MAASLIAVDAMGGDFGPRCIVPACLTALAEYPSLELILVGQTQIIEELLAQHPSSHRARLRVVHAREVIAMDERPALALRNKPDSSMRQALELVRQGQAQACVSAGNTGALMALARYVLKTLPGIDRPAMVTPIPTAGGHTLLLDLGANVDCSAEHLYQFALMGAAAAEAMGVVRPRVALLNVGSEEIKGNQQVKLAASLLRQAHDLNFVGYVEGDGLYRGEVDVAVCDGFVGNIVLKSSEGLAALIASRAEALCQESLGSRLLGSWALPALHRLKDELAPAQHNGASFLGLQGIVVKSHGGASEAAFVSALAHALHEVRENLPQRLHARLGDLM